MLSMRLIKWTYNAVVGEIILLTFAQPNGQQLVRKFTTSQWVKMARGTHCLSRPPDMLDSGRHAVFSLPASRHHQLSHRRLLPSVAILSYLATRPSISDGMGQNNNGGE